MNEIDRLKDMRTIDFAVPYTAFLFSFTTGDDRLSYRHNFMSLTEYNRDITRHRRKIQGVSNDFEFLKYYEFKECNSLIEDVVGKKIYLWRNIISPNIKNEIKKITTGKRYFKKLTGLCIF